MAAEAAAGGGGAPAGIECFERLERPQLSLRSRKAPGRRRFFEYGAGGSSLRLFCVMSHYVFYQTVRIKAMRKHGILRIKVGRVGGKGEKILLMLQKQLTGLEYHDNLISKTKKKAGESMNGINYEERTALLKALANPVRLRIVHGLLQHGCRNVTCMEQGVGVSQSCISQHLQKLRAAGVVSAERQGNEVYYRVASGEVAAMMAALLGEEAEYYVV